MYYKGVLFCVAAVLVQVISGQACGYNQPILAPPCASNLQVVGQLFDDQLITALPSPNHIIAAPPCANQLIAAPPCASQIMAAPPCASQIMAAPPCASQIIAAPPCASQIIVATPCANQLIAAPPCGSNQYNQAFATPFCGRPYAISLTISPCPLPAAPYIPVGLTIASDDLLIAGPVLAAGMLPFAGTVALEGALPACGAGSVSYNCGDAVAVLGEAPGTFVEYGCGCRGI